MCSLFLNSTLVDITESDPNVGVKKLKLSLPENFETYSDARKDGFLRMYGLKEQGVKVVGTFCSYTPNELVLAAGAVPVGLCGASEEGIAERRDSSILCS